MWLFFSITSAVFLALQQFFEKRLSMERGVYSAGWMYCGLQLPFLVVFVFLFGHFLHLASLPFQFWWPLSIIWFVLYPIQTYFYVRSMREGELSHILPVMSILPVFNIFISWALLGEVPSALGILGIVTICTAVFIMLVPKGKSPFKLGHYSKAGIFMLVFCLCVAFGSSFDKISAGVSEPFFYALMNNLGGAIVLYVIMLLNAPKNDDVSYLKKNIGFVAIFGLVQAAGFVLYILSLHGGLVSYILAIRTSSSVLAVFLGFLFYKEKITKEKFISLLLIVLGLVFLAMA